MPKLRTKRPVTSLSNSKDIDPNTKRSRIETLENQSFAPNADSLNSLCEPWNRVHFFERVKSYTPINWFGKPNEASPLICALYGWTCTGIDTVACPICELNYSLAANPNAHPIAVKSSVTKFLEQITKGHKSHCPWNNNASPHEFTELPRDRGLLRNTFTRCFESFTCDNDGFYIVPKLDGETRATLLQHVSNDDSKTLDEGFQIPEPSDAMFIAACGWRVDKTHNNGATDVSSTVAVSFLECQYCNRQISFSKHIHERVPFIIPPLEQVSQNSTIDTESTDDSKMETVADFLRKPLPMDTTQLASKLSNLGFHIISTPRLHNLQLYPTQVLQQTPSFVSQRESALDVAVFGPSGVWPRRSSFWDNPSVTMDVTTESKSQEPKRLVKKRKRSEISVENIDSKEPEEDRTSKRLKRVAKSSKKLKRRHSESIDESMPDKRVDSKRRRISNELSKVPKMTRSSRKRNLSADQSEPTQFPDPKRRRTSAPLIPKNPISYFSPLNQHKESCPYVNCVNSDDTRLGWMVCIQHLSRDPTILAQLSARS